MGEYDVKKSCEAQREYCRKNDKPHFAPYDGVCWKCRKNIYEPQKQKYGNREYTTGITTEQAGSSLVTGCPHCNRSFDD